MNAISNNTIRPAPQPQQQQTQQTNKSKEQYWRCGGTFSPRHMNQCAAQQPICSICKKTAHLAKMCRTKIPPLPTRKINPRGAYQLPQGQGSTLRLRQIQENLIEEEEDQEEQNEVESVDPESAIYINELSEDWADVNHIAPSTFSEEKKHQPKPHPTKKNMGVNINHKQIQNTVAGRQRITKEFYHPRPSKQNNEEQLKHKNPTIY